MQRVKLMSNQLSASAAADTLTELPTKSVGVLASLISSEMKAGGDPGLTIMMQAAGGCGIAKVNKMDITAPFMSRDS